ncbi:uncharacterized protein C1orf131 homolog [Hyperolius riggenbachi]|uniref:uncharacterized protein C1orf131 homolog n=1 Tax=Hyperolius riggenbachi TaxID=752182 RepID=UPI0035A38A11
MAGIEEEADVQDQLDSLLSNMYDFGDDFQPNKVAIVESEQQNEGTPKEKEILIANEEKVIQPPVLLAKRGKKNASLFFKSIKDELSSHPKCTGVPGSTVSLHDVEVVTFVNSKDEKKAKGKGVQDKNSVINTDEQEEENDKTFDFEKARLEVHKFGITGYKKEKQRKFEQERAIMLGAKPPKREYVNYRVYQEKIKKQDQAKKESSITDSCSGPAKKKRKQGQKDRRKTKGSSRIVPDGQVGRFRDGALILSTKDIQKIKQSKTIK